MPPRVPQPTHTTDRYVRRLNEEMTEHGETDRSLAKKLEEANYVVPFSSINKTRNGKRQPSLDECMTVAWVFGYGTLEEFLLGPRWLQIQMASKRVADSISSSGAEMTAKVSDAVMALRWALQDRDAVAAADARDPAWRTEFRKGMEGDLRWAAQDVTRTLDSALRRVSEAFDDIDPEYVAEIDKAAQEAGPKGAGVVTSDWRPSWWEGH